MTGTRSFRARLATTGVAIALVGITATSCLFVVVGNDVSRLDRQRVDRPATQALLGVEHLSASIDQILATASGVVAANGLDSARFRAVLGPDVSTGSTIAGMALVGHRGNQPFVVTRIGDTHLLTGAGRPALVSGSSANSTLVAFHHNARSSDLGFAARVAPGGPAVYLEVALPVTAMSTGAFALVTPGTKARPVLANSTTIAGLVPWNQSVPFGGRSLELLVHAQGAPAGALGLSLPTLVLLVGAALTALALAAGLTVARRNHAVRSLGNENRLLDEALERQIVVETELRASEERFRTILRGSPDVIVLLDIASGSCEVLNRPDVFGHDLELLAAPDGLYSLVDPDDRRDADELWDRMRNLEPEQVCETVVGLRDAHADVRHARFRFSRLSAPTAAATAATAEGTPDRLLGAISDVTDRWNNDAREAQLEEALRRSQRLETVGQLAGGVAHDFNNLLAAILASAELLMDHVDEGRPQEYAEEIQRSAVRGAALVRQLLTFAQRDRAEPRVVDLNEVLSGMEPLLRRSLGEHVQLQITTTDCSTEVVGDPTHLEQVILNLAVNADAMPEGGVLWIATAIDFDDDVPLEDRVLLSVTDTGEGIPPEVRDRMFEPFVTTKPPGSGTGLGLSTVHSIVSAMQGRIEVITKPGQGTTFEISLARRFGELDPAAAEPLADEIDGAGRRILLVEDDTAVRAALAHRLQRLGFAVVAAANGSEALQVVEQRTFDLVLTDAVMPGVSGPELIAHLRELRPDLGVILMSGYTPDATVDLGRTDPGNGSAHRAGMGAESVQRLRKPFTTPELVSALNRAFEPAPTAERTPVDENQP